MRAFDDLEAIVTRPRRRDRRDRDARPRRPRPSPTGWSPAGSPASSTSPRRCSRCPTGVDVRKVDLSIELQILAYHEQRKAQAAGPGRRLMSVLVVGISHNSAPVGLLERVALDGDGVQKLVHDAVACDHVTEATVIATCNRVEIYAEVDRFHGSVEDLSRLLVERAGESAEDDAARTSTSTTTTARCPPLPGRGRAGLDGGRRGPDPRPDPRGPAPGPGGRLRRPRPQRALPAGPARRQALARRDRHRPGRPLPGDGGARAVRGRDRAGTSPAAASWSSAPARWRGSRPRPSPGSAPAR